MCGIVGIIKLRGTTTLTDEKAFRNALIIDSIRGAHSTGVIRVAPEKIVKGKSRGRTFHTNKTKGNPFEFLKGDKDGFRGYEVLIGHNRYATSGAITSKTAHPFHVGGLMGVHNGTVDEDEFGYLHPEIDVDSFQLYKYLSEHNVQDMWSKVQGDASLVWCDVQNQTVNFLRNERRPMWFASDADSVYFASTEAILKAMVHSVCGPEDNLSPALSSYRPTSTLPHIHSSYNLVTKQTNKVEVTPAKQVPKYSGNYQYWGSKSSSSYSSSRGYSSSKNQFSTEETFESIVTSVQDVEVGVTSRIDVISESLFGGTELKKAQCSIYCGTAKYKEIKDLDLKEGDLIRIKPYTRNASSTGVRHCSFVERIDLEEEVGEKDGNVLKLPSPNPDFEICDACYTACSKNTSSYLEGEIHQLNNGSSFFCKHCLEDWESYTTQH